MSRIRSHTPPAPSNLPAHRLSGESARDFYAFCIYRDLGPRRSLQKAWRAYCQQPKHGVSLRGRPRRNIAVPTKCPGAWTALSSKYQWVQRAAAYDDRCDDAQLAAKVRLIRLGARF